MDYNKMLEILKKFLSKKSLPQKNLDVNKGIYSIMMNQQIKESPEIYECDYERKLIIINLVAISNIAKSEEEKKQLINYALLCGFIQIASISHNKKKKATSCGFGNIIDEETMEYGGLTKAYIELLASRLLNRNLGESPNYIAILLIQQLEMIVGEETMQQAFFGEDKEILVKEISSIDSSVQGQGLIRFMSNIQKNNISFEDIQLIQNDFKNLFSIVIKEKEEEFAKKIDTLQQKTNKSEQQASEKLPQGKGFLQSFEDAYNGKNEISELKRDKDRIIREMMQQFINLTIEKSTYDKYNGDQQK